MKLTLPRRLNAAHFRNIVVGGGFDFVKIILFRYTWKTHWVSFYADYARFRIRNVNEDILLERVCVYSVHITIAAIDNSKFFHRFFYSREFFYPKFF